MTVYEAENIINLRDLGGYAYNGGLTANSKVFRCGIPKDPTQDDIRLLKDLGIKSVIDLRGAREAEERPSVFKDNPDFDYYHITLLEANPALTDVKLPIWKMYVISLTDFSSGYADTFRLIGKLDGAFMYHCFLGKDRTGLLSALLLGAAGVSRDEIIKNYEISFDLFRAFVEREINEKTGLIWEQDISRLQSDRENLINALAYLDENFGGIRGYLLSIGLTEEEIDKAANKLK